MLEWVPEGVGVSGGGVSGGAGRQAGSGCQEGACCQAGEGFLN